MTRTKHKILFVMADLRGGGAERVVITLANALHQEGHDVRIVLFHNLLAYPGVLHEAIPIHAILTDGKPVAHRALRVLRSLISEASQSSIVIGGLEGWPTVLAWIAARITGRRVIAWVHIDLSIFSRTWSKLSRWLFRLPYRHVDAIVCVSKGVSDSLVQFARSPCLHASVIHNPLSLPQAGIPTQKPESGVPMVLAAGRLVNNQKGFDLLIHAHARLIHHGVPHKLVILGEGPDRRQLESLIAKGDISDTVLLPGFVRDIAPWYRDADIFVLSSRFEGLPTVLLEAMSFGLPVLATDCPHGPKEILGNNEYGDLVNADDVEALANGMERLITDPRYRYESGLRAKKRAENFRQEFVVPLWTQLFDQVVRP